MIKLFLILQVLDVVTTLAGLKVGMVEANPIVRWFMAELGPVTGLAFNKFIALVILGACIWLHKPRAIRMINYFFFALVIWNSFFIFGRMARVI